MASGDSIPPALTCARTGVCAGTSGWPFGLAVIGPLEHELFPELVDPTPVGFGKDDDDAQFHGLGVKLNATLRCVCCDGAS